MAASIGSKLGATGTGTTIAVTLTGVTAGSTIAVGVMGASGTTTITCADGQGTYTPTQAMTSGGNCGMRTFYLMNANAGSHVITGTIAPSSGESYIYAKEVKGAHLTVALGTAAEGSGNGTALATDATLTAVAGDMIVAFGGNESDAEVFTKGATFDLLDVESGHQLFCEHRLAAGTITSFAANATQSVSSGWVIQGFTILQGSGAATFSLSCVGDSYALTGTDTPLQQSSPLTWLRVGR